MYKSGKCSENVYYMGRIRRVCRAPKRKNQAGFKLVEGINGLFVGFPSQKGNDDEYRDTVWAERELKDELTQLAIKEYGQEVMTPPVGMEEDNFSSHPPLETTEAPVVAEPFSDDDIPF